MEVVIESAKPPMMKVVPKSVDFTFNGAVNVNVIHPNKTKVNVFTLGLVSFMCMTALLIILIINISINARADTLL